MDTRDTLRRTVERSRPDERPAETLASTVTSADTKLAYNHDQDRFEAFIIGDINANPEGISLQDTWVDEDLTGIVADGYRHNANQLTDGEIDRLGVSMHPRTWDDGWINESSFLTQDKQALYDALTDGDHEVVPFHPADASSRDGQLIVDGAPVDGYANVYDRGEDLLAATGTDIAAASTGSNTATAVWNTDREVQPWTNKFGLLESASELARQVPTVHTPTYTTADDVADALAFQRDLGETAVIIKSDPTGTWGDNILAVEPGTTYEEVISEVETKETEVRAKNNRDDGFSMTDDVGAFVDSNGDHGYGLVEEAIAGTVQRGNDTYSVFDIDGCPVDFVTLATYDVDTGQPEVYNVTVRASEKTDLNANCGYQNFNLAELGQAFDADINGTNLQDALEAVAGRDVSYEEIASPLREAGYTAFAARNHAAFEAEQQLLERELDADTYTR